jgi:hypothetical protein
VLGNALELEEEHVPRLLVLHEAVGPEGRRVTDGESHEMVDPFGGGTDATAATSETKKSML